MLNNVFKEALAPKMVLNIFCLYGNSYVCIVRDRANINIYFKLQKPFRNVSYMPVNADIKYKLHMLVFDRVTALNVH